MTKLVFILCLLSLGLSTPAYALKISPFKAIMRPDEQPGASQIFRVENNSTEPAAVQVSVLTWQIAPNGMETNQSAEDEFVVFPAQVVLQPHESRAIRVQWLGKDKPAVEKPFRLLAEQLPVQLKDTPGSGSAVRFMLRFKAALYIAAGEVKSDISVTDIAETVDKNLSLTVVNKGNGHTLLRNPALHLAMSDGSSITMTGAMLKPMDDENVHAGSQRQFIIPKPPEANQKIVTAKLDFEPAF